MQIMSNKFTYYSILVIFIILSTCKKPVDKIKIQTEKKKSIDHVSAVVVFQNGDSRISHADLTEEKAKLGAFFRSGDKIETFTDSRVDIQIEGDSVLRLSQNSVLEFSNLSKQKKAATITLTLLTGKLYANIENKQPEDRFSILTPFSRVNIKGTSLIQQLKDNQSLVKVIKGEVAFYAKLPQRIINLGNPEITKIQDKLTANQSQITTGKQAWIDFNPELYLPNSGKSDDAQYQSILQKLDKIHVQQAKLMANKREEQELNTIIKIAPEKSFKMVQLTEELSSGVVDEDRAAKLEKARRQIEAEISKMQEVKKIKFNDTIASNPKPLKNKNEIIRYYERMEKIVLKTGQVETGAIIDQLGTSKIIVHTENGIKRIPMKIVKEIIYDFKRSKR